MATWMIPNDAVVEETLFSHALVGSFVFQQRERASRAANYRLAELAELDDQLAAHLEGLRLAGQAGLAICREAGVNDPSEAFVIASTAAHLGCDVLEQVLDPLVDDPELAVGLAAAVGWLPYGSARLLIEHWHGSTRVGLQRVAIGGALAHRHDPGRALADAASSDDPGLRALALATAGELGREDLHLHLQRSWHDPDPACRFQSRRTALLLRVPQAADALAELALSGDACAEPACRLAMRYASPAPARAWHQRLAGARSTLRLAVIGAGASGDPAYLPWLLDIMAEPEFARAAIDAVTAITGVDVEEQNLEGDAPKRFQDGPTDDPDDPDVAIPDDIDVEWPDVDAVRAWWSRNARAFSTGTLYLMGKPRDNAGLRHVLVHGSQKLRAVAAFELAQTAPSRLATFPTTAPATRQRALLKMHGLGQR